MEPLFCPEFADMPQTRVQKATLKQGKDQNSILSEPKEYGHV